MEKHTTRFAALTAPFLVFIACGSDGDTAPGSVPNVLIEGSATTADSRCPAGGNRIDVGLDRNQNGALDDDEITSSHVVCIPKTSTTPAPAPDPDPEPSSEPPTLTTVTPSRASEKCKNGGLIVKSGPDTNRNGKLDEPEVATTEEICGGGTSTELGVTKQLPDGDIDCPFGGTSTDIGLDNGAGGGVPGDGVLQPGEVISTKVTCMGGKSPLARPGGAAGTAKIIVSGGNGTDIGGLGGLLRIGPHAKVDDENAEGLGGGNVKIFRTGKVDADFTVPAEAPNFGDVKLDVTADRTLERRMSSDEAADGEYYVLNNGIFFRQDAGNPQLQVTGVHVAPNVTLTFPGDGFFTLSADLYNEGKLTTTIDGGRRGGLAMSVGRFIGSAASSIDLTGESAGNTAGNGGGLFIGARRILNEGAVDTSGANAEGDANGGHAGSVGFVVALPGEGPVYSTGSITAKGGSSRMIGGSGGVFDTFSSTRGVFVKGTIDQSGGAGGTTGGDGGYFSLNGGGGVDVRFGGTRIARGGDIDAAACAGECLGGAGGRLDALASGGELLWSGDCIATSGKSVRIPGREGPELTIETTDGWDQRLNATVPAKNLRVSGTLDARGGDSSFGGKGGHIYLSVDTESPRGQEIELLGYESLEANGGDGGTIAAGPAGVVTLRNRKSRSGLTGGLAIHSNLVVRGGTSTAGFGGPGGLVTLKVGELDDSPTTQSQALVIGGTIDVFGGDGVPFGGGVGLLSFESRERIDFFGAVTLRGGNSTGANGTAGDVQRVFWRSGTSFGVNAPITLSGGSGTGPTGKGGPCGGLEIQSGEIKATAAITCSGGNGNGAAGGDSHGVRLVSSRAATTFTSVTAPGGTGDPAGKAGIVNIDGIDQ